MNSQSQGGLCKEAGREAKNPSPAGSTAPVGHHASLPKKAAQERAVETARKPCPSPRSTYRARKGHHGWSVRSEGNYHERHYTLPPPHTEPQEHRGCREHQLTLAKTQHQLEPSRA